MVVNVGDTRVPRERDDLRKRRPRLPSRSTAKSAQANSDELPEIRERRRRAIARRSRKTKRRDVTGPSLQVESVDSQPGVPGEFAQEEEQRRYPPPGRFTSGVSFYCRTNYARATCACAFDMRVHTSLTRMKFAELRPLPLPPLRKRPFSRRCTSHAREISTRRLMTRIPPGIPDNP